MNVFVVTALSVALAASVVVQQIGRTDVAYGILAWAVVGVLIAMSCWFINEFLA